MIDINEFDAIRIGLASSKQIRDWSSGEVTKPETINYRTLKPERDGLFCERIFGPTKDWECYCGKYKRVRYKGIICERCGVEVTRQKVRRERMGHIDLAAPVSHIWFFKGVPSRIGYLLDIAPRELEKVLYFAASIVTYVDNEARAKDLNDLEDKVKAESERIYVDRDEQLADLEKRLARRRAFFSNGAEKGFDEDDDFWTRGLATWAEESALPPLEDARKLVGGLFLELVPQITTEDAKKIRELVRNAAIRDDRKLTPRELEQVAVGAEQILASIAPLEKELGKATGAKKGAITKHIHRIVDGLLLGEELHEEDGDLTAGVDQKNLDKARELGNGLLKEVVDTWEDGQDIRELTNDLCLRTDGKIQKEDLDFLIQWALKVREMYLDIESRREDTREAAVDSVRRLEQTWQLFRDLEPKMVVNDEQLFRELKDRFGSPYGFGVYFRGGMGAESIRDLLRDLDLDLEAATLRDTIKTSKGQKQQRAIKRLKVVNAFIKSENRPEWMILEAIPVIPPELRPMVQLDGGRFATSDLNDLYRRVINRNNRLKRLLDLGAPEIIVNNEKRMLQEAVDALFDNGRRGRAVTGPGNRPLKSLSDMLKGKQGRFRQNLLGKRVDYSGRSVIVAGPSLKLHQCGLPKLMALELFKPFIMSRLVERKSVQNIKAAKKYVDSMTPEVWDVLEEVIAEHPVLLNRAPTLHRLGIQAFEPILVEGKAIQVHPLVCHAFNADFDGDQMAVHLPLSAEAQAEARILMLSSNNILSPASGRPLATPTQDMVLGIYYLTYSDKDLQKLEASQLDPHPRRFDSADEIEVALEMKAVGLQEPIEFRFNDELHLTTPGRVLINSAVYRALDELLPPNEELEFDFMNQTLTKPDTDRYVLSLSDRYGAHTLAPVLDTIKGLGFKYATRAGVTISKNDIVIPPAKEEILAGFEKRVEEVHSQYDMGLITEDERHETIVNIWTEATDEVASAMEDHFDELNPVFMMANSGARGSFKQIRQLAGMRGLMANPKGEIIERPIKANFMEGLSVLEYFISTHGARKGLADTALRTADSGYLTRRLVDVSQDVIVREDDCGTDDHIELPIRTSEGLNKSLLGRVLSEDLHKPLSSGKPGKTVVAERGAVVTPILLEELETELGEEFLVPVRSVLKCRAETGVCKTCYGIFPATGEMCEIGDAVGIIAAQSIGEPGTQLTMRTFHTGGVAGADITHGLPRVVEIFEARNPKGAAILAEVGGTIGVEQTERGPKITITPNEVGPNGELGDPVEYQLPRRTRLLVGNGQLVEPGDALNEGSQNPGDLLALKGTTATELYLVGEVQKVYKSQGVEIHDKHIELIVRQMLKKVRVETNGDTDLLPGQLVDKVVLERENGKVKAKGEKATFEPLILGITKASLATESFLSAASFQETTKVLTDASIEGKVDRLLGLKENVIIGKLIPAATGLKRYRMIDIAPSEPIVREAYERDSLLQALEEIGQDGGSAIDFSDLDVGFGGEPGSDVPTSHEAGEAEEIPEVDSPLDD
ncbi:MAG TPA: DNA-directed RNA polymerase subunit beta' [Gaiellaceae bacterium]|nr:DNA-directed RNA polymerase subunit beta' [Gaiellaceae bacterium]